MVEVVALCQPLFILSTGMPFREKSKVRLKKSRRCHYAKALLNSKQQPNKDPKKPLSVNLTSAFDAPLHESPEVSFDEYLEDEKRVIRALFPETRELQLSKKEWRIKMPTMHILFLSMSVAMYFKFRYKSMGKDYPPYVPHHIPKIVELELTRWELGGVAEEHKPGDLSILFKGTIYPDRKQGTQSKFRSRFDLNMSFVASPLLGWVPQTTMHNLFEALVKAVMADSTSKARLLEDYEEFKTEKLKTMVGDRVP